MVQAALAATLRPPALNDAGEVARVPERNVSSAEIDLQCQRQGDDWRCRVTVGDDPDATHHQVEVPRDCLDRLDPGADSPQRLVESSFRFLLEREPRESIMSRFELPIIARYFPEWETEMERRLVDGASSSST